MFGSLICLSGASSNSEGSALLIVVGRGAGQSTVQGRGCGNLLSVCVCGPTSPGSP